MLDCWRRFLVGEEGQDLVEYTLLIAFVTIATACFLGFNRDSIATVTSKTDDNLSLATRAAQSGQ
jgi:Flp pilus assembly pilin Flp